jgi:anthranilate phosphoribosyltransferase
MALATSLNLTPLEGFEKAKVALESGKALAAFKTLQKLSQS